MQRRDSPVEYDDRRFKLIYATLDFKKRTKISLLATLALRAPDPETAWLVMTFALEQLRFRRLRLVLGIAALAVSLWGYAHIDRFAVQFLFPFLLGLVFLGSLWTNRRAVRVNEPIAQAPGTH